MSNRHQLMELHIYLLDVTSNFKLMRHSSLQKKTAVEFWFDCFIWATASRAAPEQECMLRLNTLLHFCSLEGECRKEKKEGLCWTEGSASLSCWATRQACVSRPANQTQRFPLSFPCLYLRDTHTNELRVRRVLHANSCVCAVTLIWHTYITAGNEHMHCSKIPAYASDSWSSWSFVSFCIQNVW